MKLWGKDDGPEPYSKAGCQVKNEPEKFRIIASLEAGPTVKRAVEAVESICVKSYDEGESDFHSTHSQHYTVYRDLMMESFTDWSYNHAEGDLNYGFLRGIEFVNCSKSKDESHPVFRFKAEQTTVFRRTDLPVVKFDNCVLGKCVRMFDCNLQETEFKNCSIRNGGDLYMFHCDLRKSKVQLDIDGVQSMSFTRCKMDDMDISGNNWRNTRLAISDSCNTRRLNVDGCVVKDLICSPELRTRFLMEGGDIVGGRYVDQRGNVSTWGGKTLVETAIMGIMKNELGLDL